MQQLLQAGTVIDLTRLETTLLALEPALNAARHPWWVLGSAAVGLHGADPGRIADLDVLLDQRDSAMVLAQLGLVPQFGVRDDQFRSHTFNRWTDAVLPVELFAGFCLFEAGVWNEYVPQSRVALGLGRARTFVPERDELIDVLHRFGRPKDLVRATALSRIGPFPSRSGTA